MTGLWLPIRNRRWRDPDRAVKVRAFAPDLAAREK
jgi:hypothetical protein